MVAATVPQQDTPARETGHSPIDNEATLQEFQSYQGRWPDLLHPKGDLGFYDNADGIGYSDLTIRLGSYSASAKQLALLEGDTVTVEIVK